MTISRTIRNAVPAGGPSQAERRALSIAGVVLLLVVVLGVWASQQPSQQRVFRGRLSMTPTQVMSVMQQHFTGPGCAGLLQQMEMETDKRTTWAVAPQLGTFEVRAYYSGLIVVLPRSPVRNTDDCRFNPRYIGPFA
jgi:hypothetical protein